jgi:drug/metabolite transporter (DMT)-like permease
MFITGEQNTIEGLKGAYIEILYLGVMSSGVGYTLQMVGQRDTNPTLASILMSLESVFAVLAGTLFGERLSLREGVGCIIMFAAIILAQLPTKNKCE